MVQKLGGDSLMWRNRAAVRWLNHGSFPQTHRMIFWITSATSSGPYGWPTGQQCIKSTLVCTPLSCRVDMRRDSAMEQ